MTDKKDGLPSSIRYALGGLFRAATLSTDPALTLSFSTNLVSATRAALIRKLEQEIPDQDAFWGAICSIFKLTLAKENLTAEERQEIVKEVNQIFKSDSMSRYNIELFRDILYCDDLLGRWKTANETYILTKSSWAVSNSILSDINMQILEILFRHDLLKFDSPDVFNLDTRAEAFSTVREHAARIRGEG